MMMMSVNTELRPQATADCDVVTYSRGARLTTDLLDIFRVKQELSR